MTEVIPNIYRLQLPIPGSDLGYVNTYLVKGDSECLLIDTGWNTEEAFNSLEWQLSSLNINLKEIRQIVVTHIHPDHYGLGGKLKGISGAKLAAHYLEKDLIESRYVNMNGLLQNIAQWLYINGVPTDELPKLQTASVGMAMFVVPIPPDVTLYGAETISAAPFSFKVIWTPGHSPGHICLYEPSQKILLSGDHILPTITPNIGLHPQSGSNPLDDYLNSLNTMKQLEVKLVLPGHENPFPDLQQRINEIVQHHEQRILEILEILKVESKTAYQISSEMTWMSDRGGLKWQQLAPLDKRLAVMETIAHLKSMRISGKIDRFHKDDNLYYCLSDITG